jgi:hypothetical protein
MDKDNQPDTALERVEALTVQVKKTRAFARAKADSVVANIKKHGGEVGPALQTALDTLYGECPPDAEYDLHPEPEAVADNTEAA